MIYIFTHYLQLANDKCLSNADCEHGRGTSTQYCDTRPGGKICKGTKRSENYKNGNEIDDVIDIEYDYDADYDQRCCNESEESEGISFHNCKMCTRCCDELERNENPLPLHCSKCQMCEHQGIVSTGKNAMIVANFFLQQFINLLKPLLARLLFNEYF